MGVLILLVLAVAASVACGPGVPTIDPLPGPGTARLQPIYDVSVTYPDTEIVVSATPSGGVSCWPTSSSIPIGSVAPEFMGPEASRSWVGPRMRDIWSSRWGWRHVLEGARDGSWKVESVVERAWPWATGGGSARLDHRVRNDNRPDAPWCVGARLSSG